jgi:hypothetical protein
VKYLREELTIFVKKTALILQIEENKKKFVKSFGMLQKAFVKESAEYQKKYAIYASTTMTNKTDDLAPNPPPKPVDYSKQYDFYTNMILQHEGDTIELGETLYRKLWLNQFDWRFGFAQNLRYYGRAAGGGSGSIFSVMADEFESGI